MRLEQTKHFMVIVFFAAGLFALAYLAVISGALAPPPGYEPSWTLRNLDTPQYITWTTAAQHEILLSNYHAPWKTAAGLWNPLMLIAGRLGLAPLAGYYVLHFLLYLAGGGALLYAGEVFCPGRAKWIALLIAACAVPLRLLGWAGATLLGLTKWQILFFPGMLDYGYETADGLFRAGISALPTLTEGSLAVILTMALLARYVQTWKRGYFHMLCAAAFGFCLLHPFEVFVIIGAAAAPLLYHRRWRDWVVLAVAAAAGMVPFLWAGARTEWIRDTSESFHGSYHPFWILINFGIPCFLTAQFLLVRFRMPEPGDLVLRSWFITVPLLTLVPGIPVPIHLLNGFAYCIGFLLVRRIACDPQMARLVERRHRGFLGAGVVILAFSLIALSMFFTQVWKDGRRAQPLLLVNSLRPLDERPLFAWINANTAPGTLILSPPELAPWISTLRRVSLASHDFSSITYADQLAAVEQFYKGEATDILERYGVGLVLVPKGHVMELRMPTAARRAEVGNWRLFQFGEAQMKPYPGLAALVPGTKLSTGHRALEWLGDRLR